MSVSVQVGSSKLRLVKGDLTSLEVDAFVFYAQPDLSLGSGFGTAISVRGGPSIKAELEKLGPLSTGDVTVTTAGNLKAGYIIHAVGPRFLETDIERKLKQTVLNCLTIAEERGLATLAFPPMGAGFYGIPLEVCARVQTRAIHSHLARGSKIKEVLVCVLDSREFRAFEEQFDAIPEEVLQ